MITFPCPQCGGTLTLPVNLAGAQGPCLYCSTQIVGPIPNLNVPARLVSSQRPAPASPEPVPAPLPALHPAPSQLPQANAPVSPAGRASQHLQQAHAPVSGPAPMPGPQQTAFPSPPQPTAAAAAPAPAPVTSQLPPLSPSAMPVYPTAPDSAGPIPPAAYPGYPAGLPASLFPLTGDPASPAMGPAPARIHDVAPWSPQPRVGPQDTGLSPVRTPPEFQAEPPSSRATAVSSLFPKSFGPPPAMASPGEPLAAEPDYAYEEAPERKRSLAIPLIGSLAIFSLLVIGGLVLMRTFSGDSAEAVSETTATPKPATGAIPPAANQTEPSPDPDPVSVPKTSEPVNPDPPSASGSETARLDPGMGAFPDANATLGEQPGIADPAEPGLELVPRGGIVGDGPDIAPGPAARGGDRESASGTEAAGESMAAIESRPVITNAEGQSGLLDAPIRALQAFLDSPTWEQRILYSLYPERMRSYMMDYYQDHEDGVITATDIRYQHDELDPETNRRFWVFHLTTEESLDGYPVLVEEALDGLRVDWATFVEFKDNHFQEFISAPQPGKERFHLIMKFAHYFGGSFPEIADLTCYRVYPPIPDQEIYAFAKKGSLVDEQLLKHVQWGSNFTPYLELQWAKSSNGTDYIEIARLLGENWRQNDGSQAP